MDVEGGQYQDRLFNAPYSRGAAGSGGIIPRFCVQRIGAAGKEMKTKRAMSNTPLPPMPSLSSLPSHPKARACEVPHLLCAETSYSHP